MDITLETLCNVADEDGGIERPPRENTQPRLTLRHMHNLAFNSPAPFPARYAFDAPS